jgi:hypothetical protein
MGYTLNGANDSIVDLDSNALAVSVQGALSAASVSGDGSGLTSLNASNITTGALSTTTVTIDDYLIHDGDTDTKVGFPLADTFAVNTAGSERLRVDSSGNVGIGTASPTSKLDIKAGTSYINSKEFSDLKSNAVINFIGSVDSGDVCSFGFLGQTANGNNPKVYIQNANSIFGSPQAEDLLLQPIGGNVGIGTTSPGQKLHIYANDSSNGQLLLRNDDGTAGRTGISLLNAAGQYFNIQHAGGSSEASNAAIIENFSAVNGAIDFYNKGDGKYTFRTTDSNNLRFSILNNGNVGVGGITPSSKLHVDGDVRMKTLSTNAIGKITPVYARGTGSNNNANRIVRIGDTTHVDGTGRGLALTIINASTHAHVSSASYDTYGNQTESNNLATALEGMTDAQIGILTSWDAFEDNMTGNLITACFKLGLTRLAGANDDAVRHPYCAIFYGPGASGVPGNHALEVMKSDDASGAYATLSTFLIDDSFIGQTLTNALYSGTGDATTPTVIVDRYENVGIGTANPGASLEVKLPSNDGSLPILSLIRDGVMSNTSGDTFRAIEIKTQQTVYSPVTHASINLINYNTIGSGQFGLSQPTRQDTGLGFSVIQNGSAVENALVIRDSGNVGIGTTSPSAPLEIASTRNTEGWSSGNSMFNVLHNNGSGAYYGLSFGVSANHGDGVIQTFNKSSGAQYDLRLQPNGGNVGIGTKTPVGKLHINTATNGEIIVGELRSSEATAPVCIRDYGSNQIHFYYGYSKVGSITSDSSYTYYNTTSDYRLKENVIPLVSALERVNDLDVYRFNFITDTEKTVDGFFAHEVQSVVPEAITGVKDETEDIGVITNIEDGKTIKSDVTEPTKLKEGTEWTYTGSRPVYQSIDQSKLVPLLTKAIQELKLKNDALEARIAALENA